MDIIHDLSVIYMRNIYVDKSVTYRGTLLWNQLRDNVKNSPNFNIFKEQVVSFLRGSWMSAVCCNCAYICTPESIYVYTYQVFVKLQFSHFIAAVITCVVFL